MATVLIVDPHKELAELMASVLEIMGHNARRLEHEEDVASIVNTFQPDAAFVDLPKSGGKNTFDIAKELRQYSPNMRLFGMSMLPAHTWPASEINLFEKYLLKPVNSRTMRDLLGESL